MFVCTDITSHPSCRTLIVISWILEDAYIFAVVRASAFEHFSNWPSHNHTTTTRLDPAIDHLTSKPKFKMSGLLGNDKNKQEGGVADGATGVASE